ncbi:MAG: hypothetical protein MZV63_47245 [Marinilabiliales bacterium]|nr:hypothetical protein [Marinilabiliales bacterium]
MPTAVPSRQAVTINIAPTLAATAAVDDDPIGACPTSVAHLSTTVSGGEGGYTYLWDNAGTLDDATKANPTAKPAVSTLYTVLRNRFQRLHHHRSDPGQRSTATDGDCQR